MTLPPKVWDGVLRRLEGELPASSVDVWLRPLTPVDRMPGDSGAEAGGALLRLSCPSPFHRDRVREHFLARIESGLRQLVGEKAGVRLELGGTSAPAGSVPPTAGVDCALASPVETPAPATLSPTGALPRFVASDRTPPRSRPLLARRTPPAPAPAPRRTPAQQCFDNFVVGPCNALAREATLAMARDRQLALNQIYLCASAGMGKTHLCRAMATEAGRSGRQRVVYATAEAFTTDFTAALRDKDINRFKRRYRQGCDVLIVENVGFFEGKNQTQLEFFHTMHHVLDAGGRVLLTGDRLPRRQSGLIDPVRDQLASGFVAEMEEPDARVRREILRFKAAAGGFRIPEDCLDLLVESVRGSVREIESVLIQLVTTATLLDRKIDLALAKEALEKKCGGRPDPAAGPGIREIVGVVAGFFKTTPEALCARSRRRDVLLPRQLAMYLCHCYTDASLTEIGRSLGRDHPAVRNAVERIERELLERAPLRYQVESLRERIDEKYGRRPEGPPRRA